MTLSSIDISHFQTAGVDNYLIIKFLKLYEAEILALPDQFDKLIIARDYLGVDHLLHSFRGASEVVGVHHVSDLTRKILKQINNDNRLFCPENLMIEFRRCVFVTSINVKKKILNIS